MALSKNYNKTFYGKDVTYENAYIRIDTLSGDKFFITLVVRIYESTKTYMIDEKTYTFKPDISDGAYNFIKQGYEYLKTLSEYRGFIDLYDEVQTV